MAADLCLGTVQIGMHYGVNNALGRQPTEEEAFAILCVALERGIRYFDTASDYGTAETLMGKFHMGDRSANIITKLRPRTYSKECVLEEIRASLDRLGVPFVYGCLLHHAEDMYHPDLWKGMVQAKREGLIQRIGVSIYDPEEALDAAEIPDMGIIQIPYNVLDQRLDNTYFFELAQENGIEIYARSPFLQGLLLMDPETVPMGLQEALPYLLEFRNIAGRHGFTPREAAFLYPICHCGIRHVVFGVDTAEQLQDNMAIIQKAEKFSFCWQELHGAFKTIPRKILMPSLWRV